MVETQAGVGTERPPGEESPGPQSGNTGPASSPGCGQNGMDERGRGAGARDGMPGRGESPGLQSEVRSGSRLPCPRPTLTPSPPHPTPPSLESWRVVPGGLSAGATSGQGTESSRVRLLGQVGRARCAWVTVGIRGEAERWRGARGRHGQPLESPRPSAASGERGARVGASQRRLAEGGERWCPLGAFVAGQRVGRKRGRGGGAVGTAEWAGERR